MRADKRCENCEWWDYLGELGERGEHRCLRWPGLGNPWLWVEEEDRCWQWAKRMRETEFLPEDLESLADPEKPIGLVRIQDIEQVDQMSSVDDMASSLAHARLRLAMARRLLDEAYGAPAMPERWQEQVEAWLNIKD